MCKPQARRLRHAHLAWWSGRSAHIAQFRQRVAHLALGHAAFTGNRGLVVETVFGELAKRFQGFGQLRVALLDRKVFDPFGLAVMEVTGGGSKEVSTAPGRFPGS